MDTPKLRQFRLRPVNRKIYWVILFLATLGAMTVIYLGYLFLVLVFPY